MSPFRFKRFSIHQTGVAHPLGTDTVLLGAWAAVEGAGLILDIGTGTGAVALMLAQRSEGNPQSRIVAVEPHQGSFLCAVDNFKHSPWAERLVGVRDTIQGYAHKTSNRFNLIATNPPFFSDTIVPPDPGRRSARHTAGLPPGELLAAVNQLLAPNGRFCAILPPLEGQRLCEFGAQMGLYCTKRMVVYPRPGKPAERWLLQLERDPHPFWQGQLFIYEREEVYSEGFGRLTRDFYQKF